MTRKRILSLALFIVIILAFWLLAQMLFSRHMEAVRVEEERIAEEEKKAAEEERIQTKLKTGDIRGPENLKIVFLTFDDGPNENSNQVLDILKANDVKATFFTNGREGEEYESIYKRIVDEGHTLGNHTWSHDYSVYDDPDTFYEDVEKLSNYQKEVTGEDPSMVFRFPGGSPNANQEDIDLITQKGYNYYDWNVQFGDGLSNEVTKDQAFQEIIDGVHGQSVSIVLAHSENPMKTGGLEALDDVIKQLKSEGYRFMALDASYELPRFTSPTGSDSIIIPDPGLEDS